MLAVVRLPPAADRLAPNLGACRKLIRPVHPVHARVDVLLVLCADLEDLGHPVGPVLPSVYISVGCTGGLVRLLALHALFVGNEDKVVGMEFLLAHCAVKSEHGH